MQVTQVRRFDNGYSWATDLAQFEDALLKVGGVLKRVAPMPSPDTGLWAMFAWYLVGAGAIDLPGGIEVASNNWAAAPFIGTSAGSRNE